MAQKKVETSVIRKGMESASEDDSSNLSSSDSVIGAEQQLDHRKAKKQALEDDDGDDEDNEDKTKSDDGAEELSDSALQRQSKRKPSKSRIKRIVHEESPGKTPSRESTAFSLPPIDSLVVVGPQHSSSVMSQASMVSNLASSYLQMSPGGQSRTPGGYKCDVCNKVFRVPSRYESHMQNHSKGKPFCCDMCGKLFSSQMRLDIHKPVHGRDRREAYDCPQCGQHCTSWRAYLYHVSKHIGNGGKRHTCQVCGRQFFAAQRLRNHMQSHMDGKNFCCLKCGKLFESQKRLDTHLLIHDSERKDPFRCVDCGKKYDDWRAFKQHNKTHSSEGVVYTCELCASQFITQYEKEKHMKVHSADQRQPCPHCSKSFWTQSQLAVHLRNKHRNSKVYECVLCGRECARASGLKQHMKMHAGDNDFFCHLCGRTFDNGSDLAAHSSIHGKDRPFACDQCGKCFAKKTHYHGHLLVHASGQQYPCAVCGKQFDHALQLATHMTQHAFDGQQKFACRACSFIAPTQVELEAHAHTHGKTPPYVCGLCGNMFAEQRYFRQHMKRHMARSQKKKRLQQRATHQFSLPLADTSRRNSEGDRGEGSVASGDHPCHMCGQQFRDSQALVAHIEEHQQSGLQKYLNVIRSKKQEPPAHQKQRRRRDGSYDGSRSASDSEGSEKVVARPSKTTIHFGMQMQDFPANSTPKSSHHHHHHHHNNNNNNSSSSNNNSSGILTQTSEQTYMPSFQQRPVSSSTPLNTSSQLGSSRSSVTMTPHSRGEGMDAFSSQPEPFYSTPVFPGQGGAGAGGGSYATPYHAAAQQFHPGEGYPNGSLEAMDYSGAQFGAMPTKRLPDFADFARLRQMAMPPGKADFPFYSEPVPNSSSLSHSSPMPGGYAFPEGLAPSPGFGPSSSASKSLGPGSGDDAPPPTSMPVFPSMSSFSHMPPHSGPPSRADSAGQPLQFETMFQFQPLGN